jgi:hypothetical protein
VVIDEPVVVPEPSPASVVRRRPRGGPPSRAVVVDRGVSVVAAAGRSAMRTAAPTNSTVPAIERTVWLAFWAGAAVSDRIADVQRPDYRTWRELVAPEFRSSWALEG